MPINVSDEKLEHLARTFGCQKGTLTLHLLLDPRESFSPSKRDPGSSVQGKLPRDGEDRWCCAARHEVVHWHAASDQTDRAGRCYNSKADRVMKELWVRVHRTMLIITSH